MINEKDGERVRRRASTSGAFADFDERSDRVQESHVDLRNPSVATRRPPTPAAIFGLQRAAGNQAVRRLLVSAPDSDEKALSVESDSSSDGAQSEPSPALAMRARLIARNFAAPETPLDSASVSPSSQLRSSLRTPPVPHVQRNIKGSQTWGSGKLEIDFAKNEGAAAGDQAFESGQIKFTPSSKAKPSSAIHMIQIVRTIDTSGPTKKDYTWTGAEAPRNSMMTTGDTKKNVAGGWFVDQVAGELKKRTKKSDAVQKPYYDKTFTTPRPGQNQVGKTGKPPVPATLDDAPGYSGPLRFLFNTSVKGDDNGVFYGTVLWGFEIFHDKAGVAKIKGEYKKFRSWPGATLQAAVKKFDEYYQNPGSSTAPTT